LEQVQPSARPTPLDGWALIALSGFLGLTAVAGGLALVTGVIALDPIWLNGSPFDGYLVPGLALTGVGLLALAAVPLVVRRERRGLALATLAGLGIVIYEAVELVVVPFHFLQVFYIAVGLAMIVLAWRAWTVASRTIIR